MKVESVPIATLSQDPANARKHDDKNLEAIKASLRRFGQQKPIVVDSSNVVRAGNGTLAAATALGWDSINVVQTDLQGSEATAYAIADNRTAELAEWDESVLAASLSSLADVDETWLSDLQFSEKELAELVESTQEQEIIEDEVPEPPANPITKPGDLWVLGRHRLLCGDSTKSKDVARLMSEAKASMVHADPPYGMGKEKEGVLNDNLHHEKLDAFQMAWWRAFRPHIENNASAYIWGNPAELWRLWYCGGLADSERMTLRNEITWDKREENTTMLVSGVPLESRRMYHPTERCLFFMLGEQGFNNNADNYWEGWEPIRSYFEDQMKRCGWKVKDLNNITETQMANHWVTRSQWSLITAEHYKKIQQAAREHDAFKREHDELKREHDELKREFYSTRAYFDNTHDSMTDVWDFRRVTGDARHGHATPKPVEMVARAFCSSSKEKDVIVVPFGGSGPDFIAAEQLDRTCYGMELSPQYCDVIVERWEKLTGKKARLEGGGSTS